MKKHFTIAFLVFVTFLGGCDEGPESYHYPRGGDDDDLEDIDMDTSTDSYGDTDTYTAFEDSANICDEIVSVDLSVDGIPAYSQCAASLDATIWSDDGVNTSTQQVDSDWIRTQWSMGYQCTEYAHRYLYFVWGVTSVPNGNAGTWCDSAPPSGLTQTSTPVHGDIMVFAPGSCGASQTYGHVAVVDTVDLDGDLVEFVEQNGANRRSCAISTAACFLHADANTEN